MRTLYLRIYLTVVLALALFAGVSGVLVQRHLEEQRVRVEGAMRDRTAAWGEMIEHVLPAASAPAAEQAQVLRDWAQRLHLALALDDAHGQRVGASDSFQRRETESAPAVASGGLAAGGRLQSFPLADGRTLWLARLASRRPAAGARPGETRSPWVEANPWFDGANLAALLVLLFVAVAGGAWPVVRRLTRRLEALKLGVEAFGAGALHQRVAEDGRDEVAAVGASFNRAAARIEMLLRSHQSLLANASHELRSPLARLKMAVTMMDDAAPTQRPALRHEIDTDIAELDALVEEVLLASRLDAAAPLDRQDGVDLLGIVAEEAARVGAAAQGDHALVAGEERLLRRAVRNLLENARRYGGADVEVTVAERGPRTEVRVCDRGPGVPDAFRERIFEPFFRVPGHAEREGGIGLGLSLVRQIAQRHDGSVRCEPREGGGSCFVLELPAADLGSPRRAQQPAAANS